MNLERARFSTSTLSLPTGKYKIETFISWPHVNNNAEWLVSSLHSCPTAVSLMPSLGTLPRRKPTLFLFIVALLEDLFLQLIGQPFMRRTSLLVVYVSLPTTADMIILMLRPSFVHCRLWDHVAIMCTPRIGRFDAWRIDVARTTALYA